MKLITYNLYNIWNQMTVMAEKCGRNPQNITLLAVSKNHSITAIKEAVSVGQYSFGENYAQEGVEKIKILDNPLLSWHFIGRVQSNKSRLVSEYFDWCHTVSCFRIAQLLNKYRSCDQKPINVLIQINISYEETKAGILLEDLPELVRKISYFPRLKLRGLMAIPKESKNNNSSLMEYQRLEKAFNQLKDDYPDVDTLSLGMSGDINDAIICGSTMLRIGTSIFGKRHQSDRELHLPGQ
ncbi:Pyridoxal phosphate homeostasis protein [Candidatus Erwinia haradaeae]|uniref:Pyridoxal phosphate homeostasis protein n=1 Tax=Candidatus Erwinia haradaeae TaxID=1922217 RepID=A0A451D036_9GAMM|nr:YggS family pyridoxal phosphate-dependent enzyme [Candidatus Erwinia haradaeae]VFP78987.1 Pyridoxal phosphate homeostasis protein [Candidatus Erwinia haradaeae]